MKKRVVLVAMAAWLLCGTTMAAQIPEELLDALPKEAEELLEDVDLTSADSLAEGAMIIVRELGEQTEVVLRQRIRNVAAVLLVVILCGAVNGFGSDALGGTPPFLNMTGGITITLLTAGSLDSLIGLGGETIRQLSDFSKVLLPTMATAVAAGGMVSGAAVHQVSTALCVDLLLNLIHGVLLPVLYLYIGVLAAGLCLEEKCLQSVADLMKRGVTWVLTTALVVFTLYLSVVRIVSGTADGMAVRVTKTVISGVVPVVGGIISEASETLLVGAGVLKNTVGILGMLAILAVCAYPFLQLGIQYLLYKAAAFLAEIVGTKELCKLIHGLGGAFGLMLGMTGACALLLLVSILAAVSMAVL